MNRKRKDNLKLSTSSSILLEQIEGISFSSASQTLIPGYAVDKARDKRKWEPNGSSWVKYTDLSF